MSPWTSSNCYPITCHTQGTRVTSRVQGSKSFIENSVLISNHWPCPLTFENPERSRALSPATPLTMTLASATGPAYTVCGMPCCCQPWGSCCNTTWHARLSVYTLQQQRCLTGVEATNAVKGRVKYMTVTVTQQQRTTPGCMRLQSESLEMIHRNCASSFIKQCN